MHIGRVSARKKPPLRRLCNKFPADHVDRENDNSASHVGPVGKCPAGPICMLKSALAFGLERRRKVLSMSDELNAIEQKQYDQLVERHGTALFTVLHGFGRVATNSVKWMDNTKFVGGVAKNVPGEIVARWLVKPIGKFIQVLPDTANEGDYIRASGIQPMATAKFAAMLNAMDLTTLAGELGPESTRELAEKLLAQVQGQTVTDSQGKVRQRRQASQD